MDSNRLWDGYKLTSVKNKHALGDQWNGEDLSIFSVDDRPLALTPAVSNMHTETRSSIDQQSLSKKQFSDVATVLPGNLKAKLRTPSMSSENTEESPEVTNSPGFRAAEAYVRPCPIATLGRVVEYGFDLRNAIFTMKLESDEAATESKATEIYLPEFHFPAERCQVEVSGGKWTISVDDEDSGGLIQRLRWWHAEGEQTIKVIGQRRRQNMALGKEEEEGYLDQCQQSSCMIM